MSEVLNRCRGGTAVPVDRVPRVRFNPDLTKGWFASVIQVVKAVIMLAIILTGAGLDVVWPRFPALIPGLTARRTGSAPPAPARPAASG